MGQFLEIGTVEHRKGLFGFRYSARFGDGAGVIAWGGESQNDRVYFSVQGKGCSMISRWADLADWLQRHKATIKRVDLAHDDHAGRLVSIAWAVQQYEGQGQEPQQGVGQASQHRVRWQWDGASISKDDRVGCLMLCLRLHAIIPAFCSPLSRPS